MWKCCINYEAPTQELHFLYNALTDLLLYGGSTEKSLNVRHCDCHIYLVKCHSYYYLSPKNRCSYYSRVATVPGMCLLYLNADYMWLMLKPSTNKFHEGLSIFVRIVCCAKLSTIQCEAFVNSHGVYSRVAFILTVVAFIAATIQM